METKIEITLKSHVGYVNKFITGAGFVILFIWFLILYYNFTLGGLIGLLLVLGAFILYLYILGKHPVVVTADAEK